MGNIKSNSYKEAIQNIKSLKITDFEDINVLSSGSIIFPIQRMALFLIEKCLIQEKINDNLYVYCKTIEDIPCLIVRIKPISENMEIWLESYIAKHKILKYKSNSVDYIFFKMVEEDIIKIAQKNSWNFIIQRKVIDNQIVVYLNISEQNDEQKKSNTRVIKTSFNLFSDTSG